MLFGKLKVILQRNLTHRENRARSNFWLVELKIGGARQSGKGISSFVIFIFSLHISISNISNSGKEMTKEQIVYMYKQVFYFLCNYRGRESFL